jgi:hypothetical protein
MRKPILTSAILSCGLLGASPALSQYDAYPDGREPAYYTTLYSDASHTTEIGYITPQCGYRYVQYTLEGTYSIYASSVLVGYCTQAGWDPL